LNKRLNNKWLVIRVIASHLLFEDLLICGSHAAMTGYALQWLVLGPLAQWPIEAIISRSSAALERFHGEGDAG
jgi:hypothetical protein